MYWGVTVGAPVGLSVPSPHASAPRPALRSGLSSSIPNAAERRTLLKLEKGF